MDSINKTEQVDNKEKKMVFKGYLKEYEECCNSYRHIYTTIWASAVAFFALSSAILAFGVKNVNYIYIIQFVAIIPILFWFYGIFMPMDSYGDTRSDRQREIEELLKKLIPELKMEHASGFKKNRAYSITVTRSIWVFGIVITFYELFLFAILLGG